MRSFIFTPSQAAFAKLAAAHFRGGQLVRWCARGLGALQGLDQLGPQSPLRAARVGLPACSDVDCGNASEYTDFSSLRCVDHENTIVRNELSGATVKEQQEFYFGRRSIGKIRNVASKLSAIQAPKDRTDFACRQYVSLDCHNRVLS